MAVSLESKILQHFGTTPAILQEYADPETDDMPDFQMQFVPLNAATHPELYQTWQVNAALSSAAESLGITRRALRFVMSHLPEGDACDPYRYEHPITRAVMLIRKLQ